VRTAFAVAVVACVANQKPAGEFAPLVGRVVGSTTSNGVVPVACGARIVTALVGSEAGPVPAVRLTPPAPVPLAWIALDCSVVVPHPADEHSIETVVCPNAWTENIRSAARMVFFIRPPRLFVVAPVRNFIAQNRYLGYWIT
jgi:hypothetical protein